MTSIPPGGLRGGRSFFLLGAVLAGGEGRRYGGDKTAAEVGGLPMLARAVKALRGTCDAVAVVSSREDTLPGSWPVIPDLRPGRGPLAGIEGALSALARQAPRPHATEAEHAEARHDAVVVLAADMPLVGPNEVAHLVDSYQTGDPRTLAVAAARRGDPPYQPLCALYALPCLPVAERLLDEGRSAARDLFAAVDGVIVEMAGDAVSVNVNTPRDHEVAEARLRARPGTMRWASGAPGAGTSSDVLE